MRQRLTAGVGAVVLVVVVLALNFYRLPVVALSPGPAEDVLTRVKVQGPTQVYDSKGRFYLTSVGIDDDVRFFEAILDLANRDVQLRPRSDIYPQGESTQQVNEQNANDMDESKVLATVVALRKLGYKIDPSTVDVTEVRPGAPADGKLRAGDHLVRIEGRPVTSIRQLQKVILGHKPGDTLALSVKRGDHDLVVRVPVALDDGQPRIGVVLREEYGKLPVPVSIDTENIGGPSAGLMFALSIYDRLTPGDLTGGRRIAGTGQISEDGTVVPIGGIGEKIVGAKRQGATMFLLPRGNCDEARRHPPVGLRLVPVSNVSDAIAFLQSKPGDPAPRC
ncbi:MAG TPA: PDZ domain-containing protein [Actinomycetes bacterium]|nr:PDZ domain-containing protein [Actinomycetes bacterium]